MHFLTSNLKLSIAIYNFIEYLETEVFKMKGTSMLKIICYWLVVIGALNYGLMAFDFNFLEKLPAHIGQIISIAIAVAAIITIVKNLKK